MFPSALWGLAAAVWLFLLLLFPIPLGLRAAERQSQRGIRHLTNTISGADQGAVGREKSEEFGNRVRLYINSPYFLYI